MKGTRLPTLAESSCFFPRVGLEMSLNKLLKMNRSGSYRDVVSETAKAELVKKKLPTDETYKFADFIRTQTKEVSAWTEDGNIVMTFFRRAWILE